MLFSWLVHRKNSMTCFVNCTCRVTHFFNVASLTYISVFPFLSKSVWFKSFTLNIWYNPWKYSSWYISLKDEWFEQEFYMSLIGENHAFFCCVTHAYFFQYYGWARKAISLKDPQFISQISMFHIKTIKELQCPSSKYNYTIQRLSNCHVTHVWKWPICTDWYDITNGNLNNAFFLIVIT